MSCLPRLRAVPACGPFDQRPHGAASQLLGKVGIGDGDSLGDPPGRPPPFATTAVPVPADRKLSLYRWWDKQAESQLFYLLGEIDQGSGLGLGPFSWRMWERGTVGLNPTLHWCPNLDRQ